MVLVHRPQAKTRVVDELDLPQESSKTPRRSRIQTSLSLLRSRIITARTLAIVVGVIILLEVYSRDCPCPSSDFGRRPAMVQMHSNNVIRLALQANSTRFIQDRRNHYWRDNGINRYKGRRTTLREGCKVLGDWQEEHNPSCNKMHEIDMTAFHQKDIVEASDDNGTQVMRHIKTGGFRKAWMISEYDGTKRVLKTLRYSKRRPFDEQNFNRHRIDAVAMEQLTASPYVADIYGYCANSALVDCSTKRDLSYIFKTENPPTKDELFKIALDTALAVADVHHFNSDGRATMVHKDISPRQWIHLDGMYKLNDFNLAKFLSWDTERNQNCGNASGYRGGRVSLALNENVSSDCSCKSDTFPFFLFYFIISGKHPSNS
jgi:hypothetical protein